MAAMAALWQEAQTLRPLLGQALRGAATDPAKLERLRALLRHLRSELASIAGEHDGPYV